jgi:hypothetical protein
MSRAKWTKNDRLDAVALYQRLDRDELVGKNAFSTGKLCAPRGDIARATPKFRQKALFDNVDSSNMNESKSN